MKTFFHGCLNLILVAIVLCPGPAIAQDGANVNACEKLLVKSGDLWSWVMYDMNFPHRRAIARLFGTAGYARYNRFALDTNRWALMKDSVYQAIRDGAEFRTAADQASREGRELILMGRDLKLFRDDGQLVYARKGDQIILQRGLVTEVRSLVN